MLGHHSEIGLCCTLGPGVNIAGLCRIGQQVYFGIGAIVLDRITIGDGSLVAAGALVTKDVPARSHVAGFPARILRTGIEPK